MRGKDDPQYEIKSRTTDHIAMHKGVALKKAIKTNYHAERRK